MIKSKKDKRQKVRFKIRKRIVGSADQPRLAIFRSNKEIYAQLIDDASSTTLAAASSRENTAKDAKLTKVDQAKSVGKMIAERAKKIAEKVSNAFGWLNSACGAPSWL